MIKWNDIDLLQKISKYLNSGSGYAIDFTGATKEDVLRIFPLTLPTNQGKV